MAGTLSPGTSVCVCMHSTCVCVCMYVCACVCSTSTSPLYIIYSHTHLLKINDASNSPLLLPICPDHAHVTGYEVAVYRENSVPLVKLFFPDKVRLTTKHRKEYHKHLQY